ncbi:MAG TPA: transposase [Petrimonas sp.]|jgi:hypothetical protein|nr:transposase [Petrimonas sp.]
MAKVQKISQLHPTLGFTEFDILESYRESFYSSELGKLHQAFPFSDFCKSIGLKENRRGRKSYFSPEGKVALMLLKAYTNFSDAELIEHLNGNIHYQLFCGVSVHPSAPLTNYKIVSDIRVEIAHLLDIDAAQRVLAEHWKPYLENLHVCMIDATCYETHMRYPTDVKLMWECVHWLHTRIVDFCKELGVRRPRNKFADVSKAYLAYSKKRKKNVKRSRKKAIARRLKQLLAKLLGQMNSLLKEHGKRLNLTPGFRRRLSVIESIRVQQERAFEGEKVSNRIVSVDKPYIRPIVRGKETKNVEFGAKSNNIMVDDISFIEHVSFDAFNEGTRLKQSVFLHQRLMKTRVKSLAADAIYATNENRRFCTRNLIYTSFVRKGRAAKDEKERELLRKVLSRERATRMEGSFGTQKVHYSLIDIRARKQETELLWIFFGIHTANAVKMIEKMEKKSLKQSA